jgi:ABC transporter substrate binding protein
MRKRGKTCDLDDSNCLYYRTTGSDPVGDGLVASLARPGGNLTGVSILAVQLVPKRLELLSELVPQARMFALLVNPKNGYSEPIIRDVQEAAGTRGVQLNILRAISDRCRVEPQSGNHQSLAGELRPTEWGSGR